MRIGIVTINSVNFGNRLQNYAMQTVLQKYGAQVETIRRKRIGILTKAKMSLRNMIKNDAFKAFCTFDRENINYAPYVLSNEYTDAGLEEVYDRFVIGSDQVWNPSFSFNSDLDYLPDVASERKIAYSASFGISQIPSNRRAHIAKLLNGIPAISVREDAGAGIVKELTGRDVPVVLDPTLLLHSNEWRRVSRKPRCAKLPKKFIVKYVLGSDVNSAEIEKIANEAQCEVVDMFDSSIGAGPAEFVWLIEHSEMVCTDSFHASVFALIFHRPLAIYERVDGDEDMSSRFDTLCSQFEIKDSRSSSPRFAPAVSSQIDWDAFERKLNKLRIESFNWLEMKLKL